MAKQPLPDPLAAGESPVPALVQRTGIALVHEGELVLPAEGSEAGARQVIDDSRATVQYYFPVEVEVRESGGLGGAGGIDADMLIDMALRRLAEHLENA